MSGAGEAVASAGGGVRHRALELKSRRAAFVLATVVRAERPTSAKAGDAAIVLEDGTIEGFVGGECAEASVQVQALRALQSGQPVLLRIAPDAAPGEEVSEQGTVTVHNPCLSGGRLEIFLEPELPAPLMVVHGASPIAEALASIAEVAGYVVVTDRADTSSQAVPRGASAVVVASHGRGEEAVLTDAVRAAVPYVGLVASRTRGAAVLERLELSEEERARIHTPAGLDLGGRRPEEIAVSILAEIIRLRREHDVPPGAVPGEGASQVETAASTAIDPVCGMTVAVTARSLAVEYAGEIYSFCGSGCRDAFSADPAGTLARR